ncbi:hypothetical protein BGZ70_010639 [Mortierella alpina]|uniref:Mitotic checkpoint regulator, MAD2B-interacting-domain-containing protein n=1 Tax=Mortierella alpina TaxID=64518 RepID=A0A9P6J1Z0_MORAP|nr:hypothetical protein BGZ70_010639 [Mortierella alpina]
MLPPPKAQSTSNNISSGQATSAGAAGSAGKVSKYSSLPTMDSDPDSDEESEFRKKAKIAAAANSGGSGVGALFAMLPAPKNAPVSGSRSTVTVAGKPVAAKSAFMPRAVKKPTAVPASVKLATKSEAAKDEDEDEDDEDEEPVSFFPLGAQVTSIPSESASASSKAASNTYIPFFFDKKPLTTEEKEAQSATLVDVSLSNEQYAYPTNDQYAYPTNDQYAYPTNDQYSYPAEGHVADSFDSGSQASTGGRGSNTIELDDVGLQKLGMRKARDGPINVIDVYAKDQMNHAQQVRQAAISSNSQVKPVDLGSIQHLKPTAGQKRKHNIMSLAYQAKANEQQLNASWASSRQTKAETQSKYGF